MGFLRKNVVGIVSLAFLLTIAEAREVNPIVEGYIIGHATPLETIFQSMDGDVGTFKVQMTVLLKGVRMTAVNGRLRVVKIPRNNQTLTLSDVQQYYNGVITYNPLTNPNHMINRAYRLAKSERGQVIVPRNLARDLDTALRIRGMFYYGSEIDFFPEGPSYVRIAAIKKRK
jgi:hypothetical protein